MYPVILVGLLHLVGTSKKTGEPYDFYMLQYIDSNHNDDRVVGSVCVNDVACDPEMLRNCGISEDDLYDRLTDGFVSIYVSFDRRGNLIKFRVKED